VDYDTGRCVEWQLCLRPVSNTTLWKRKTTLMLLRKKGARNRNGTSVDIVWTHCGQ
jgi:hypothetical protein